MYWLRPPATLRRIGAVVIVLAALVWDLAGTATEPFPVAARPIAAGSTITEGDVEWIELPAKRLPQPDLSAATAAIDIGPGEPISAALLTGPVAAPPGTWTVSVAVGTLAAPGDEVLLVVADPPTTVIGLVVTAQVGDPFDLDHRPASIAVPAEAAALIAAADRQGLLVTAVRAAGTSR